MTYKSGFKDLPKPPEPEKPADAAPTPAPVAEPPKVEPKPPEAPKIALDVFAALSGRKPDQTRGFQGWARRQGLTRLSRAEWEAKWAEYLARPV
jgi:hypothetical protein